MLTRSPHPYSNDLNFVIFLGNVNVAKSKESFGPDHCFVNPIGVGMDSSKTETGMHDNRSKLCCYDWQVIAVPESPGVSAWQNLSAVFYFELRTSRYNPTKHR